MKTAEQPVRASVVDRETIRRAVERLHVELGFPPEPSMTPQRARELALACGVRPEDNIGSRDIVAERER
jgi:hypothetical protein